MKPTEEMIRGYENKKEKLLISLNKNLNLRKELKNSKKHLDFGCGHGNFTYVLSKHFPKLKILGFDLNNNFLKDAHERYKDIAFSNKLVGKFDSATVILVLHEIKSGINKNLKLLYNKLNDKGIIVIYDFRKTSKNEFRKLYKSGDFHGSFEEEYNEHNKWTPNEFQKIMENAGFKTIKIKQVGIYYLAYVGKKFP